MSYEKNICPNCGMENENNNKFCIKCGSSILTNQNMQTNQTNNNTNQNSTGGEGLNAFFPQNNMNSDINNNLNTGNNINNNINGNLNSNLNNTYVNTGSNLNEPNYNYTQPNQNVNINVNQENTASNQKIVSIGAIFSVLIAVLLKPFTTFKEELPKFKEVKNSLLLSLIVSLVGTILMFVNTIITLVRIPASLNGKTTWMWDNLKNFNYFKTFGTDFLTVAGVILAIACIYYIASLIIKKQIDFSSILMIVASAVVPLILAYTVVAPLISMINIKLSIYVNMVGLIYSFIIIYENINDLLKLTGNQRIYFNFLCLVIVAILAYYLYTKFMLNSISSGLGNLNNLDNLENLWDWMN